MFTRSYRRLIVFAAVCLAALPAVVNAQQGMQVTERGDDERAVKLTLDFVNVELKELIQFIQRETDLTIISTERDLQGKKLSLVNLKNVTIDEAMEKIKTGLMQFDLTTIQTDSTLLITTVQKAVRMKVPVSYGADPESIPDSDQVITHVIPLKHLNAEEISGKLGSLKSDAGVLFGDRESNTIVITGIASNIRRMATFLAQIDVAGIDVKAFKIEVIQINNTEVDEIKDALEDLFGSARSTSRWFYEGTGGSSSSLGAAVFITSNDDTNQLIVRATQENIDFMKELIEKMDVAPSLQTEVRVFPLRFANAEDIVDIMEEVLEGSSSGRSRRSSSYYYSSWYDRSSSGDGAQGIAGEVHYAADERLNAIVISSDPSNWTIIETLIEQLDQQDDPGDEIEIFLLKNADAEALVENIQELIEEDRDPERYDSYYYWRYGGGDDEQQSEGVFGLQGRVNLTADTRLNAIVAATSSKNLKVLKDLIERMDVSMPEQEWGTRIYPLKYADATKIAEVLNSVYQGGGQQSGRGGGGFFSFLESVQSRNQRNTAQGSLAGNVVAAAYPTTNSIIISTGTARNFELIEEFIKELDVQTPEGQREITRVFNLEYSDATQLEPLLSQIWSSSQDQGGGFPFFGGPFGRFSQPSAEQNTDINSLIDKVSLFADEQTNSLVITTRARYIEDIEKIVRELDIVRGQVWIDIHILELTLDDSTKMGIEMQLMERRLFGVDAFGKNRAPGSNPLTGQFNSDLGLDQQISGFSVQAATNEYMGFLHMLMRSNKVRTLSSPGFMVRDNQTATFVSGRDIPYLQSARTSDLLEGQIFDFDFLQDIGINISITPRIARITASERGKRTIGLQIDQITASNFIEFTNFNAPLTEESTVSTFIDAEDGQQIVIGGLKKRKQQDVEEKVPILGDLPLLGALFRKTETVAQDSEVVIVITPHIVDINNPEDRARMQDMQYQQYGSHEDLLTPLEETTDEAEAPMQDGNAEAPVDE